ncbi:MAG TPA: CoA transferase [Alphaproteobacteria bacterium]|nr:CoA transferase [Alphaproteobacteria bacterium]
MTDLPLDGVRILDLTSVVYGPYATQILGDLGGDVIKIEPPKGDDVRNIMPAPVDGISALFSGLNRNKRSVCLDLKTAEDLAIFRAMISGADMLVHNMRPAKMRRLGLSYDEVAALNPKIIYGDLVGYGQDGPMADQPAYDDVIQGCSGISGCFVTRSGEPDFVPNIIADKTTGVMAVNLLLAALYKREKTGQGAHVEVPMFETMVSFTFVEQMAGRAFSPALGEPGYERVVSPMRKPYKTKDGHICLLAYNDGHWKRFFELIGRHDLASDPAYATMVGRSKHISKVYEIVEKAMATRRTDEWIKALRSVEIACGPVRTLGEVFDDEHLQKVGFFQTITHSTAGDVVFPSPAGRFNGEHLPIRQEPPVLDGHADEVMKQFQVPQHLIDARSKGKEKI